ncbi:hypothetical protein [Caldimonas sp. KR1-144]|uniref:hypothetical protein n=1 Tax=Caldimonas sp. KR1-144 TaxID=3400911 RepID=UPI003C06112A
MTGRSAWPWFVALLLAASPGARAAGACTSSAQATLKACGFAAADDFWIAQAQCDHLRSASDAATCREEAKSGLKEAHDECREQHDARLEACQALGEAAYDPVIDPARFVDPASIGGSIAPNPFMPLVRGRMWRYAGGGESIEVTVTNEVKTILGVRCAVVRDTVREDGEVIEDTEDWFAQDIHGNVWYFGEISREFEDGELISLEGSWKAGVDGAKPGIVMKAQPMVGVTYRQEFAIGSAEDLAKVVSVTGSAQTPATRCVNNCLVTRESTPLSPGDAEFKYYAPGIGLILEVNAQTDERVRLVEFSH